MKQITPECAESCQLLSELSDAAIYFATDTEVR